MRINGAFAIALLLILGILGCQGIDYSSKGNDVPTNGNLIMGVEKGDSFLIEEELSYFHQDYPNSHIKPVYQCEVALLRQLQMDSMRFVVMNRDFTAEERDNLELRDIKVRSQKIAETSIALIVSPSSNLDSIDQNTLRKMLKGEINTGPGGSEITLVFDESCGSNFSYFSKVFLKGKIAASAVRAIANPQKLIEYISTHPDAIGFVGLNWIADRTEALSRSLLKSVKVLKVKGNLDNQYHLPFQSQIKARQYPFVQQVFMHDLQGYNGLAKGFISFVASQPGQIMVKKSGLIPAHDFGRTIVVESE